MKVGGLDDGADMGSKRVGSRITARLHTGGRE